jgi:hypothetical protein
VISLAHSEKYKDVDESEKLRAQGTLILIKGSATQIYYNKKGKKAKKSEKRKKKGNLLYVADPLILI